MPNFLNLTANAMPVYVVDPAGVAIPGSPVIRRTAQITPSDNTAIDPTKALLVVSGGTIVLQCSGDTGPQTYPNLPPFTELRFEVVRIWATGTSATDIRALY